MICSINENNFISFDFSSFFIYLIISSIAESAFVNPIAIPLALIMGLNTEQEDYNKMEGEKYYEKK